MQYNYGSRKIYRKFHITRDVNEEQTPFFYQSTDSSIDQVILMSSVYLFLTSLNKLCRTLLDFGCLGFCTYVRESTHDHDLAKTFLTIPSRTISLKQFTPRQ